MRKPYIDLLSKVFLDYHKDLRDQGNTLVEHNDKIIVWLIGLSTGTIALLVTSADKFNFLNKAFANKILIVFLMSILLGILGRIFTAISFRINSSLGALFDIQLKMNSIPHYPRVLKGTENFDDIYEALQEDFDVDLKSFGRFKELNSGVDKNTIDEIARQFYEEYAKWCKEDYGNAFKKINEATVVAFGFKNDYFDKQKKINNRRKGLTGRYLGTFGLILYAFSSLSFILGLFLFTYKFLAQ